MFDSITMLKKEILMCEKCSLSKTRNNVVVGEGNEKAKILIIGEAPGRSEDEIGEPFVGRSGKLLDKMMLNANLYRQTDVYITNIVKCRPPQNRNPSKDEISECIKYLQSQIHFMQPQFIICLGRVASQIIIDKNFQVTKQHGELILKDNVNYMGTFHPAAILRNPKILPTALEDYTKISGLLL